MHIGSFGGQFKNFQSFRFYLPLNRKDQRTKSAQIHLNFPLISSGFFCFCRATSTLRCPIIKAACSSTHAACRKLVSWRRLPYNRYSTASTIICTGTGAVVRTSPWPREPVSKSKPTRITSGPSASAEALVKATSM